MIVHNRQGKDYVLCAYRRRFVRLTPEEWIRQQVLAALETTYHYPHHLLAVEVPMEVAGVKKRADAVLYAKDLQPLMLMEFKAQTVAITRAVLDQAVVYNRTWQVPYLLLSNGTQTVVAQVQEKEITFLASIPEWTQLSI